MQMRERLEALEALVKDMQVRLERPATDAGPQGMPQQSATGKHALIQGTAPCQLPHVKRFEVQ